MTNIFFPDEEVNENDLYFLCYMIERISRKIKRRNSYVVNHIARAEWLRLICLADAIHCDNPAKVEDEWIDEYHLEKGDFDVFDVDAELVSDIPTETQMGKVYTRLIVDTMQPNENYVDGLLRVYNNEICELLDNYNCGAYYEPSYVIARAYNEGGF